MPQLEPRITISPGDRCEYRTDAAKPATCAAMHRPTSGARPPVNDAMFVADIRASRSRDEREPEIARGTPRLPEDDADVTPAGSRTNRLLSSWWWSALALAGLLVGVMAFISDPAPHVPARPAGRLLLELPDEVWAIASVAGSLAIMLWFAFLIALARRHQKNPEKGRSLWGVLVFSLIVTGVALWHRELPQNFFLRPPDQTALLEEQKASHPNLDGPAISLPLFTGVVGALFVGAAIASLGVACLVVFGDRLAEWWGRTRAERHPLATAVDESLDDLGGEMDPRLAIIRCYRRFEVVLASSRFPRAPWQTPLEFMRKALARLPVPPMAVERLTRLFERARFSNEVLSPSDRDVAWSSLVEIRQRLELEEHHGRPR